MHYDALDAETIVPKPNYLVAHFSDPRRHDRPSRVAISDNPNRLKFLYLVGKGDWNTVARFIFGRSRWPVDWIPDSNIAFLDATTPVWDALRAVALGNPDGATVVTGVVEAEMTEWLNLPYRNQERAANIKAALDAGTRIKRFLVDRTNPYNTALCGYAHLLGFRRFVTQKTGAGTTLFDTDPADKSGTMNAIRKLLGPRAQDIAKKGRDDAERHRTINISDEMNVLMAVLYALLAKRNSIILTADRDYVEIFYKVQWFLDTHYRAWLAAKRIKEGRYGEPAGHMGDTKGYFDGRLTLYKRPTYHLREVLPADWSAIQVGVLYVAPDGELHRAAFSFELKMLAMLQTRAATNGRCTDLFGDANLHVDLGPLKNGMDGLYLGVGKDATREFNTNGVRCQVSRLDLEHSICCFENFTLY
jgi:hypothetical protein